MPAPPQLGDHVLAEPVLDDDLARRRPAARTRRGTGGVPGRRVDRRLQVQPAEHVAQQEAQLPLVLLVAAGGAERQGRHAVAQRQRRRERGARALARQQRVRQARAPARSSAPGCPGGSRARGWSASSAASRRTAWPRRCCPSGRRRRRGRCRRGSCRARRRSARRRRPARRPQAPGPGGGTVRTGAGRAPTGRAGPQLGAAPVADERPPLSGVGGATSRSSTGDVRRVAVPGLAVGHRQLHRLDAGVDQVGSAVPSVPGPGTSPAPSSIASAWSSAGPCDHGPAFASVHPRQSA